MWGKKKNKTKQNKKAILLHISSVLNKKSCNKPVQEMEKLVRKVVGVCSSNLGLQKKHKTEKSLKKIKLPVLK